MCTQFLFRSRERARGIEPCVHSYFIFKCSADKVFETSIVKRRRRPFLQVFCFFCVRLVRSCGLLGLRVCALAGGERVRVHSLSSRNLKKMNRRRDLQKETKNNSKRENRATRDSSVFRGSVVLSKNHVVLSKFQTTVTKVLSLSTRFYW